MPKGLRRKTKKKASVERGDQVLNAHGKGYKGVGMEDKIAIWYAKNTAKDMAEFCRLAGQLSKDLLPTSRVLEVAAGPGYLSIELAKRGLYQITGLDISDTFVGIARENAKKQSVQIDFQQSNASAMPFPDDTFDLIVCRAAFKNFSQPEAALDEMHRVLKPGGRAIIMDLRKDVSMKDINAYIENTGLDWKTSLIYKLTFRFLLIPRAYSKEQFMELALRSRFGGAEINDVSLGFEITPRKNEGALP